MIAGIALVEAHALVPAIGDAGKARIERGAQVSDQVGQGISEVAVFALAEAVPRHDDMAAEVALVRIERGDGAALLGADEPRQDSAAETVELAGERRPVAGGNPLLGGGGRDGGDGGNM